MSSEDVDQDKGETPAKDAEKAETASKADTADKPPEEEREGGLLPALLVGAGLLAVVALLVFGGGDDEGAKDESSAKTAAAAKDAARSGGAAPAGKGGVEARQYDKATVSPSRARLNPAVKLPNVGMAPQGGEAPRKNDKPPENATRDELITWHEKKLAEAQRHLEQRATFKERLPGIRERIESSNHPNKDKELEAFEGRKKIVEDNYEKAKKKVEELEAKLAELRG